MSTGDADTEHTKSPGVEDAHATNTEVSADNEADNPELVLDDRDKEGWEDVESDGSDDGGENSECDSEEDDRDMYE